MVEFTGGEEEWLASCVRRKQGLCVDKDHDYDEVRALYRRYGFTLHRPRRGAPREPLRYGGFENARGCGVERPRSLIQPVPSSAGALGEIGPQCSEAPEPGACSSSPSAARHVLV